jgi:hypothetical protein
LALGTVTHSKGAKAPKFNAAVVGEGLGNFLEKQNHGLFHLFGG